MQAQNQMTNLVLSGSGVGAIAYAGFFKKVEENGFLEINQFKRIAGVSSGSIAALQVALNYSVDDMIAEVRNTNFEKFADAPGGFIADVLRFFTEEGIYKAEYLYCYIRNLIKNKTGNENVTFHDLQMMKEQYHFKDLYIITTRLFMINNISAARACIFSHEQTPYARVLDAVRASASLPIIFPPMRLRKEKNGKYSIHSDGDVYVDGGIIEAYPVTIFDYARYLDNVNHSSQNIIYNSETLGLKLDDQTDIALLENFSLPKSEHVINNGFQYARALLYVLTTGQQNTAFINSRDQKRTIFINTLGISSTNFALTSQQKDDLLKSGEKAVEQLMKFRQYVKES